MADDKKKELPSCVVFGLRYWKRLCTKFDSVGFDWMTSKVQHDWFLACYAYEFLHGMVDNYDQHDYKLFVLLGYKLIDLVSSVNFALNSLDKDKKEN